MTEIRFGTDGWRAIIAKEYTVENVERVAEGTAQWMLKRGMKKAVVGYDCRFGGVMFAETVASVFGNYGIKTILSNSFVSTPMVSLAVVKTKSDLGIVITASHNPPMYNGYKLKSSYGGPTGPQDISEVESLIPATALSSFPTVKDLVNEGLLEYADLEKMYLDHVKDNFDLDLIEKSGIILAYDGMYGAGQSAAKKIFKHAHFIHCDFNPSFEGVAPEPILRNLYKLQSLIQQNPGISIGLANDGDADRIGLFDDQGNFIDSHHILLLLLHYFYSFKNLRGKVVITFSVTDKVQKLAQHFGLDIEVTKIGFKYIAEIMTKEDILVGGEESGGLAVKGHIPERDGIWIGLVILEFMAFTGKSLSELIQDIYTLVGPFYCDRDDLHLTNDQKNDIIQKCQQGYFKTIGSRDILRTEDLDGFKYYVSEDEFVMLRASGTEPVLRVYGQAPDLIAVRKLIDETKVMLLNS